MSKIKVFETMDIWLSAYLSLNGLFPQLQRNGTKVVFQFPISDELYKLLMRFNSNEDVPVTDYVTTVKTLRGQMLTMRDQR